MNEEKKKAKRDIIGWTICICLYIVWGMTIWMTAEGKDAFILFCRASVVVVGVVTNVVALIKSIRRYQNAEEETAAEDNQTTEDDETK